MMKTDTSEKVTQTFNGLTEWGVAGSYFKLMATVSAVDVRLFHKGQLVHKALAVEGGHYQRIDFDRVQITTGALEAVSWIYAPEEGGTDRVIVAGTLGQLAQALRGGSNVLLIGEQGDEYTSAFASTAALVAGTPENVIAAASNTAGIRVVSAGMQGHVDTYPRVSLLSKATAPASAIDGDVLLINAPAVVSGADFYYHGARERPVLVASGKRLDFFSVAGADAAPLRHAIYRLF